MPSSQGLINNPHLDNHLSIMPDERDMGQWISKQAFTKTSIHSYSMACQAKSKTNVHGISNCLLLKKQVLSSAVSTMGTRSSALLLPLLFQNFSKYRKQITYCAWEAVSVERFIFQHAHKIVCNRSYVMRKVENLKIAITKAENFYMLLAL